MNKREDRISLSRLYKSNDFRDKVWDLLCHDFNEIFERLIKEATNVRSLLVKPAKINKFLIKELVIEYGEPLDSLSDLKNCLDILKSWDCYDEPDWTWLSEESKENSTN